jgi:hypothetical protein
MKRTGLIAGVVALSVGFGTPVYAQSAGQLLRGGALGAGAGAIGGALIPGVSVGTGALIGGAAGAGITALNHHKHRYYRDRHGRRYYTNTHGYRLYR